MRTPGEVVTDLLLRAEGAGELEAEEIPTPRGGVWTATAVQRLLRRMEGKN